MIDARLAYAAGVLVGGATATLGWGWLARHPARLLARHRRMVLAWNSSHGPRRGLDGDLSDPGRARLRYPVRSGAVTTAGRIRYGVERTIR